MILSSADILRVLGADAIVRQEARLSVVEGRPGLDIGDSVYIYVDKYPTIEEFEATWKIWVTDNSGMGEYVLNAMTSLLPNFEFVDGHYVTRDFASERTVVKTEAEKQLEQLAAERQSIKEDFSGLQEGLQARLSAVRDGRDGVDGRDGLDGRDGRDGVDGRDGRDLDATEVELFDLKDVDESLIPLEKGQVLTWDGSKWTNLYVRQVMSAGGAVSSTATSGDAGVSATIGWTYHPHDHTEEPNSGHFHTDSVDGELVTVFHVSNETSRGNDVEVLLRDLLQQGYDRIYVALGDDPSQAHLYSITGYTETTSGFEINVIHVETAGLEPDYQNAKLYEFLFTKSAVSGGGGSSTLAGLIDTDVSGAQDGYILVYNSETGIWEAKPNSGSGGGGGGQCDGILDGGNADDGTSHGVDCPTPGIEEAPEDGQQYARQDGAWEVVITGTGDVEEAPMDGNFYVRQSGSWVDLRSALSALGVNTSVTIDGGNFTDGTTLATDNTSPDGGNFTSGTSSATTPDTYDGGVITGTNISGEIIDGGYWS